MVLNKIDDKRKKNYLQITPSQRQRKTKINFFQRDRQTKEAERKGERANDRSREKENKIIIYVDHKASKGTKIKGRSPNT